MIPTRGTDERFAIRNLIDNRHRGWSILKGFFEGTVVTEDDLTRVYCGVPIADEKWVVVKEKLKERMPRE
jgi:hypothetical protein